MNHTIVVDEDYRDHRLENRLNAAIRHCKIGNVISKRPASIPTVFPMPSPVPMAPFEWPSLGTSQFMAKCGCKVGTVCMNAACPYAARVTCNTADILGDQRKRVTVSKPDWPEMVCV